MASTTDAILYEDSELCIRKGGLLHGYSVTGRAGVGAFCVVLESQVQGLRVAIRVLKQRYTAEHDVRAIDTEERILSLLNQCYPEAPIITQMETFEHEGRRCMVLQRAQGTLWDVLGQDWPTLKQHLFDIAVGLAVLEDAGVIHADLKPCNILMVDNKPKLADFNCSKWLESSGRHYGDVGTLRYMAPETLLEGVLDTTSDVWSYGCVVAAVLWGDDVFRQNTHVDVIGAIVDLLGQPPTGSSLRPSFLDLSRDDTRVYGSGYSWSLDELVSSSVVDERDGQHVVDLLSKVLQWGPESRPSAKTLLEHPLFQGMSTDVQFSKAMMKAARDHAVGYLAHYWQTENDGWDTGESCEWDSVAKSNHSGGHGHTHGTHWGWEHSTNTDSRGSQTTSKEECRHLAQMTSDSPFGGSKLNMRHWDYVNHGQGVISGDPEDLANGHCSKNQEFGDHTNGWDIHGYNMLTSEKDNCLEDAPGMDTNSMKLNGVLGSVAQEAETQPVGEEKGDPTGRDGTVGGPTVVDLWCYFWHGVRDFGK